MAGEDVIFLDEFGITLAMPRPHARAPRGARAKVTQPFPHGRTLSVMSALGRQGLGAPLTSAGAVNSAVFALDGEPLLVPCVRPGPLVVLDTVTCPYAPQAIELREAAGAAVWPIPAYSPDLNPLEEGIAKLTETLRSLTARTKRKLSTALAKALAVVTEADIRGWFEQCGYIFSLK